MLTYLAVNGSPGAASLYSRYSFNDGTASDSITQNAAGTLMGTPSVVGGKVELSGAEYISLPTTLPSASPGGISFEMWVDTYSSDIVSAMLIYLGANSGGNGEGIYAYNNGGVVSVEWTSSSCGTDLGQTFDNHIGMHFVFTIDNFNSVNVYVNGEFSLNLACSSGTWPDLSYFYIGSPDHPLYASLDEVRVWAGVLSAVDVAEHYSQGPGAKLLIYGSVDNL